MHTRCLAGARERKVEPLTVSAHPSGLPRGHAEHQREVRDVPVHGRARADKNAYCPIVTPQTTVQFAPSVAPRLTTVSRYSLLRDTAERGLHTFVNDHARAAEDVVLER